MEIKDIQRLDVLNNIEVRRSSDSPSCKVEILIDEKELLFLLGIHPIKVSFNAEYKLVVRK